ncbi:unnamed protein product [Dovyalis caffra]|uniref:SNRNP25 ubiquitin-like domain-containing protein n=1 Tax=Dovyalis caffra TaxID=77055 RepID=A0AAV1SP99_9ROSI|nr:unnamed protein product [Dovyalis caffra]
MEDEKESSMIQLADFRIDIHDDVSYSPTTSLSSPSSSRHRHRRFASLPSLMTFDGRRSSFSNITNTLFHSYNKLPEEPLKLSVLKLDGTSFDIEAMKSATVGELRQAVEAVFSYMPQEGPGKISWPHVWGHFCLCYDGQKLLMETDYIKNYGIKDGDQLQFIRHVSGNYSLIKKRSVKQIAASESPKISLSPSNRYEEKQQNYKEDDCHDNDDDILTQDEARFCCFFRRWNKGTVRAGRINMGQGQEHTNRTCNAIRLLSTPSSCPLQTSSICVAKKEITPFQKSPLHFHTKSNNSTIISHHLTIQRAPQLESLNLQSSAMANMIMASSKPLITLSSSSLPTNTKPKLQIPQLSFPKLLKITKPQLLSLSTSTLKSLSLIAATSLTFTPPSLAEEIEKAALFDFNLTLPIIMFEFLFLMVALDKVWFTPLGKFMDERDAAIKEKLGSVKDTSEEVKQLEEQAAAVMRAARAEISAALNKMKKETQGEVEQKLAEGRKKIEVELQEALAKLESQKEETIKALDSQIAALSDDIVKKALPTEPINLRLRHGWTMKIGLTYRTFIESFNTLLLSWQYKVVFQRSGLELREIFDNEGIDDDEMELVILFSGVLILPLKPRFIRQYADYQW